MQAYMQAHEHTAIYSTLQLPKVCKCFVDQVYSILKRTHLENVSHHINNLYLNIKFTMKKKSTGKLVFLDTILKRNDEKTSVLVYRKTAHIDQYLHYIYKRQAYCKENIVSSLFNRAYSIIINNNELKKKLG